MKPLPLTALCLSIPLAGSCVVVAAGVGAAATYGYVSHQNNVTSREFQATPELAWKAVLHGMKAQEYEVEGDPQLGTIEGLAIDGDTEVRVERVAGGTSRVKITIGTFESEQHERLGKLLILEIARRLGES